MPTILLTQKETDRELEIERNHLCNCQHCKKKANCFICGSIDKLHRCHIVPHAIIDLLAGEWDEKKWKSYNGMNVFILCKKHHRGYDLAKLNKDEMDKIAPIVKETVRLFYDEIFSKPVIIKRHRAIPRIKKFVRQNKEYFELRDPSDIIVPCINRELTG